MFNTIVGLLSPQHQGYKRVEWRLEDFYMERWDIFLLPQAKGEKVFSGTTSEFDMCPNGLMFESR